MCASMVDIQFATAEITRGKETKKEQKERTRMWANAQTAGRPANIDGAFCSTPQSLADGDY